MTSEEIVEVPDSEVETRPKRRRFTAEYKARILREAERCEKPGEIGALLRREGLYASHLITWRRQREKEGVAGLSRKRGRKADPDRVLVKKIAQVEGANRRLTKKLQEAEIIIAFQKKWPSCGRCRVSPRARRTTDASGHRSVGPCQSCRGVPIFWSGTVGVLSTTTARTSEVVQGRCGSSGTPAAERRGACRGTRDTQLGTIRRRLSERGLRHAAR
jgi:transposase-like protein